MIEVKNLTLANGDYYEGGKLHVNPEFLVNFVKLEYDNGTYGYLNPDYIMSFDFSEPKTKLMQFPNIK